MTTKINIKQMILIAISVTVITICSWINVPFLVPFTMQTFAIYLVLMLLGAKKGLIAILAYTLLGTIGIPVFSGFSGGVGIILGPTGGFIIGFTVLGIIYLIFEKIEFKYKLVSLVIGTFFCYACGTVWFSFVYGKGVEGIWYAISVCVIPFIIPDIVKLIIAKIVYTRLKNYI